MTKRIILITGTPCVGKTATANLLTSKLNAKHINLTELATRQNLIVGKDAERNSIIINENKMKSKIHELIEKANKDTIIDGHYAPSVVPKKLATHTFVLRRDPVELKKHMEKCGFSGLKLWENLASEILDVCLVDALKAQRKGKVCEIDVTGKSVEEIVNEILDILDGRRECCVGVADWLGKLEREGLLSEYLKI